MKKIPSGFTLIELIVTIAVISIMIAIGVPSLNKYAETNRSAAQTNLITGTLSLARSEAIKRGVNVIMCASTKATSTTVTPKCDSTQWDGGWIVFADSDKTNSYTPAPGGTDTLLAVHGKMNGGLAVTDSFTNKGTVIFQPNGALTANGGSDKGTFKICPSSNKATDARAVNVSAVGLISLAEDTTSDGIVNDISGVDITCP